VNISGCFRIFLGSVASRTRRSTLAVRRIRGQMRTASATEQILVMAGQVLTEIDTYWPWRFKACPEFEPKTDLGISLGREPINLPG
jgi:hypothetical protein